jgi:predicted nucleic acid-binding protein
VTLVVDASVVVKWLLSDPDQEAETERATELMQQILDGHEPVLQPVHWLMEVAAALARLSPASVESDVVALQALEVPTADSPQVLVRACRLAIDLNQHLFDTLYHAVALETPDATLVTADDRYLATGAPLGRVIRLADWRPRPNVTV